MRWSRTLQMVEAHCEGEIGKVVTSGIIDLPGKTMQEKMAYINVIDDSLVRLCMLEPRGCAQMAANLLLPPISEKADAGLLVLLADGAHPMSGSNCICVVTVLLETGIVPITGTDMIVNLDTPAGLITAHAHCVEQKCETVTLDMPAAFLTEADVRINVEGLGTVQADIAFGGEFYALVDISNVDIQILPEKAHVLAQASYQIQETFSRNLTIQHPLIPELNYLNNVMFYERLDEAEFRTCTSGMSGRVDRSPCGTGSTALFAALQAKGELDVGDVLHTRSIIDSHFYVRCREMVREKELNGIQCELTGRAWIHGIHQVGVDPSDPFANGFALSDTWGPVVDKLNYQ